MPILTAEERLGQLVDGKYRVEKMIGEGGMAQVFKAHDTILGEHVALKVFDPHVAKEDTLARFKQELKLTQNNLYGE